MSLYDNVVTAIVRETVLVPITEITDEIVDSLQDRGGQAFGLGGHIDWLMNSEGLLLYKLDIVTYVTLLSFC